MTRSRLLVYGTGVLVVLLLLPVLHAPFFSDDLTYSEVNGYRRISGDGLIALDFSQVWDVVAHSGRPTFLSWMPGYPAFAALGDHPAAYHAYILIVTALAGLVVLGLLRRLGVSTPVAALAVVLGAGWMQVRLYHDSLLSFAGLSQFVLAAIAGSLWAFDRWLEHGRRRDLVWTLLLFVAACGLYEVSYSLCLAHIALAFARRRGRAAARAAAPPVVVAVLFAFATVVLRFTADSVPTDYTVGEGGGPWTIARTYAIQLVSPLPDMNLLGNAPLGADPTFGELFAGTWRGVLVAAAVAAGGWFLLRRSPTTRWGPVVAVGVGLYLAPPALLAVSPKYQAELSLSQAYLPVLIQVFALAVLALAAFAALLRLAAGRSRVAGVVTVAGLALFAGVTSGVTAYNNIRVVGLLQPERAARQLVEAAAAHGAYDALPAKGSVFFGDGDLAWQGPVPFHGYDYISLMLAHKTDRVLDARLVRPEAAPGSCPATDAPVQTGCAPPRPQAAYSRIRVRRDGGTVIVAQFDGAGAATTSATAPTTRVTVFRQTDTGTPPTTPVVTGTTAAGAPWTSEGLVWRRVRHGDDWAVYTADLPRRPRVLASSFDDQLGFINFTALPPEPERARLLGTRRLLP